MWYNVIKTRYPFVFWNDRGYAAKVTDMSLDDTVATFKDRADMLLGNNIIYQESIQFDELKKRIEDGDINTLYLWDPTNQKFIESQIV